MDEDVLYNSTMLEDRTCSHRSYHSREKNQRVIKSIHMDEGVAFVDIHLAERRIHDIRKLAPFHARLRHQIFQFKSRNIDEMNQRQMAY